jgi:dolichol-phosphate mannosyltransferase
MTPARAVSLGLRAAALAVVTRRLLRAANPGPSLTAPEPDGIQGLPSISVVIPARDEEHRVGPCLAGLRQAPGVVEVIVVDDHSTDATARVATDAGARVLTAADLPPGWSGKAWAVQQGVEAAVGDWVVTLDADTRPDPRLPAAAVARAVADGADLMTVAGSFTCPTDGLAALHPAMLTTLVYRFGPPGNRSNTDPGRLLANGQCMVMPRQAFLNDGGLSSVAHHMVEDVALARERAQRGRRVTFMDAAELLNVQMYDDAGDAWRGWGRSLALPGVETRPRQLVDLATLVAVQGLPLVRVLSRRGDALDVMALMMRLGTLVGTASAYKPRRWVYWLSPLADPVAVATVARGIMQPDQPWRGRHAPTVPVAPPTPPERSATRSDS